MMPHMYHLRYVEFAGAEYVEAFLDPLLIRADAASKTFQY